MLHAFVPFDYMAVYPMHCYILLLLSRTREFIGADQRQTGKTDMTAHTENAIPAVAMELCVRLVIFRGGVVSYSSAPSQGHSVAAKRRHDSCGKLL